MILSGLSYCAAGTIMAFFPEPYWIWALAIGGAFLQAIVLAGPKALQRFRWWSANVLVLLAIAGAVAVAVSVSVALGYVGTDQIDDIILKEAAFGIFGASCLALTVAALAAIVTAATGDRLLMAFSRWHTTLLLLASSLSGLGTGCLTGLLISAQ